MPHNRIKETLLLDYYGGLLTKHQKDILDEYYYEDLSMNEIAENYKISKSAVQDLIKRSIEQLNNYEKVLKLVEKDQNFNNVLDEMKKENNTLFDKYIKKLQKIK